MSGWELLACTGCGHEHVRQSGRRFALRCRCGGRYQVFSLLRGVELAMEELNHGCGITRPDVAPKRQLPRDLGRLLAESQGAAAG